MRLVMLMALIGPWAPTDLVPPLEPEPEPPPDPPDRGDQCGPECERCALGTHETYSCDGFGPAHSDTTHAPLVPCSSCDTMCVPGERGLCEGCLDDEAEMNATADPAGGDDGYEGDGFD